MVLVLVQVDVTAAAGLGTVRAFSWSQHGGGR